MKIKINFENKLSSKYKPIVFTAMAIVALLLLTATIAAAYCPTENQKFQMALGLVEDAYIENDYLGIAVHDTTSRFTLNNTGGDPANTNDDNQILLFGHPYPWSSFTTVRIDGSDYEFGGSEGTFTQVPTSYPTYIKSVWTSNNIQVTQTLQLANNPATDRVDVIQIRYMLKNLDLSNSHNVGLRVLLDTMLAGNDGAPFYVPSTGAVTTEHEYTGASIPDYWVAFDDLGNPTVVSQGTFRGGDATVPDRVIFVSWPDFYYGALWDYTITPGKIFGDISYPDSSVGLYWNPVTFEPGEVIEYVTYYGLSGLTQSLMPPLTLSVTGPLNLDVVDDEYSPNPFTVTAYVQDVSTSDISDVSISINLPAGLSLEPGSPVTQTISTLNPNEVQSVSWSVRAANQANEALFNYDVTASATGISQRSVTRSISVPALSLTYDTTFRSNPNGYQFPNFGLADLSWDLFRDTYGADEVEISGQPRPRALNFYNNSYRHIAAGGSCFGMAASSSVLFQNSLDSWDLGLDRNAALPSWSIFPSFLSTPTDWVEYYHPRQMDAACQADWQTYNGELTVYNELKQRMASGNWVQDPMIIGFFISGGGGHAVTPYRIEESADHQQADVRIYDNNFPDQEHTIHFNLTAGTARNTDYSANDLLGVVGFRLSAIQQEPQMSDYDTVSIGGHLLYTDSTGNQLGYSNGEFKSEIPEAHKVELLEEANNQFPETYYISNLDLKRELHGLTNGIAKVSVSRPNSLVFADVQVTSDSVDELRVPVDGSNVEFISGKGTSSLGLTLDRENTEFARVAHVDGFGVESGSAVQQLFSTDLNKAGFINKGAKKNYNLYLEQIGLNPGKYTHPVQLTVEANSAHLLTPQDWNDLERTYVQLDEDIGNDGTIDRTEVLTEIQATIDIDPDTLNLKSNGKWITAYIELIDSYTVYDISDLSTISLITPPGDPVQNAVSVDPTDPSTIGDYDGDNVPDLMVKFDSGAVISLMGITDGLDDGTGTASQIKLTIMGQVSDGTYFSGEDIVSVIEKGK